MLTRAAASAEVTQWWAALAPRSAPHHARPFSSVPATDNRHSWYAHRTIGLRPTSLHVSLPGGGIAEVFGGFAERGRPSVETPTTPAIARVSMPAKTSAIPTTRGTTSNRPSERPREQGRKSRQSLPLRPPNR